MDSNTYSLSEMTLEHLPGLLDFIETRCVELGVDETNCHNMKLAVEEICVNLHAHGYPAEKPGPVDIALDCQDGRLIATIRDNAPSFSPDDALNPNVNQVLDEREEGGLGLFLVRQLMDEVHYTPSSRKGNQVQLIKHLAGMET